MLNVQQKVTSIKIAATEAMAQRHRHGRCRCGHSATALNDGELQAGFKVAS